MWTCMCLHLVRGLLSSGLSLPIYVSIYFCSIASMEINSGSYDPAIWLTLKLVAFRRGLGPRAERGRVRPRVYKAAAEKP